MEVIKWDKQSPINGVEASVVLESRADLRNSEVFLVKQGEQVQCVEIVDVWKANLKLPSDMTTEQVIDEYKKYRTEQEQASQNAVSDAARLQEQLSAVQVMLDELILQGGVK